MTVDQAPEQDDQEVDNVDDESLAGNSSTAPDVDTTTVDASSDNSEEVIDAGADNSTDVVDDDPWNQAKEILSQAGFSGLETPVEAAQRMAEAIRRRDEQIETLASQIRYGQHSQSGQQYAPATQPEPSQPEVGSIRKMLDSWVDVPVHTIQQWIDPETNDFKASTPKEVRQQLEAYENQTYQWRELIADPRRFVAAIEQHFDSLVSSKLDTTWEERTRTTAEQQAVVQFMESNKGWLYERDPITGREVVDPISRNPIYSQEGRTFASYVQEAQSIGISSAADCLRYAEMKLQVAQQSREQAPAVRRDAVKDVVTQRRRDMQVRRNNSPVVQREINGVSPDRGSDTPGSSNKSLGQHFMDAMRSA